MAKPTTHERPYEWEEYAYKTWRYIIRRPRAYYDDRIVVGCDPHSQSWRIFINAHELGQAPTLDEAKTLAIMLFKLHPDLRQDSNDPRMPNFK